MTTFVLRRTLGIVPLLVGVSMILFGLLQAIPGGPLAVYLNNPFVTGRDLMLLRHQFGLDQPVYLQYLRWFGAYALGHWGLSYSSGQPVAGLIAGRLPATLLLMGTALLLALAFAVAAGAYSAVRQYSAFDYAITVFSFLGISMPVFWFGLMLQLVVAVRFGWLPVAGFGGGGGWGEIARHLVLPSVTLALFTAGRWSRFTRAGVLEVLRQDYIRTARAKGLPERQVVFRHALRNGLIPVVTIVALDLAALVSGAVVTETVFAWPGMGSLLIQSISSVDYPTLLAILMLSSFAIVVSNLIADVLYTVLDPRIVYR
ncbi:MAG TPA: ABC transporter permease [bacterium]|nr:ABC transporter permease [bacterium]